MRIPLRMSWLGKRHTKIKYIVIHHTHCQYDIPESKIDSTKFQIPYLTSNLMEKAEPDFNYHYIVDRILDEYYIIVGRPLETICDYDDIDRDMNKSSVHIGLMGTYDIKVPDIRMYEILGYRLLNPLLKTYALNPSRIYLHNELSKNKKESCPGSFIDKNTIITMVRRFVIS